jgi:hypothetical protein
VGLARLERTARRVLVVAIGDFLTPEPVGAWRRASRRHEVIALRVVDPREEELPRAGLIALEDAELATRTLVDSSSRALRAAYAEDARQRRVEYRRWCQAAALSGYEISTADDPIGPLIRIFTSRATRRGVP